MKKENSSGKTVELEIDEKTYTYRPGIYRKVFMITNNPVEKEEYLIWQESPNRDKPGFLIEVDSVMVKGNQLIQRKRVTGLRYFTFENDCAIVNDFAIQGSDYKRKGIASLAVKLTTNKAIGLNIEHIVFPQPKSRTEETFYTNLGMEKSKPKLAKYGFGSNFFWFYGDIKEVLPKIPKNKLEILWIDDPERIKK